MSVHGNGDGPRPAAHWRPKRRMHYPNLSPTRALEAQAGPELWPAWTDTPLEELDWDAFDENGHAREGGQE